LARLTSAITPHKGVLSIIIPIRNEAPLIAQQLALLQTYRQAGHELIIVDGDSQDGSFQAALPWADKVLSSPKGRGQQLHLGAQAAQGDTLLFLHIDTRLPPQADQLIHTALQQSDRVWGHFKVSLSGQHPLFPLIAQLMNLRACLTAMVTGDHCLFVQNTAYQDCGGFPAVSLMEDLHLSKRLKRLSKPLCLPQTVITNSRRWQQHGVIRTIMTMWWMRLAWFFGVDEDRLARWYTQIPKP